MRSINALQSPQTKPLAQFVPQSGQNVETGATTILRGSTSHPATLLFICSDGNSYQTASQAFTQNLYLFELRLPRGSWCRLWIKRKGSTFRQVTFRAPGSKALPLLILQEETLDLGHLYIGQNDATIVELDSTLFD